MNKSSAEDLLLDISAHAPGVIYQYLQFPDGRSCFPYASDYIKFIYGVTPEEVVHDASIVFERIHPDDLKSLKQSIDESARTLQDWKHEYRVIIPGQKEKWVLGHSKPEKLVDGSILWRGFITDISFRIKANRLYSIIAKINEMVLHAKTEEEVYSDACKIAVEEGLFQMAWVALLDKDGETVHPKTWFGKENGYLENIFISTNPNIPEGKGPTGVSIRENKTVVNNDTLSEAYYFPWRKIAIERGYASSISLPISVEKKVIGSFNIYASTSNFFNDHEIKLLESVTHNISYSIESLRSQRKLAESEALFSALTDLSPDIISIVNSKNKLVYVSSATRRINGYDPSEILGMNLIDYIHHEDQEQVINRLNWMTDHPNELTTIQHRIKNKDGTYCWMEATAHNLLDNHLIKGVLTISRDISQRKEMEEDLIRALALRDEFLSIASHELKTPITSLKLQLQMLSKELMKDSNFNSLEKYTKQLKNSDVQINRITELVENLLDVTKIRLGNLLIKKEKFSLSEMALELIERFRNLFTEAQCELDVHIDPDIIGHWDKSRIEQVFVNLFSNCIKYAPGKPIHIDLTCQDNTIELRIRDEGPGIPESKFDIIFNRFERALISKNISGLGLGLYITKQIVVAHGGTIKVAGNGGKGATFIVKLPLDVNL